MTTYDAKAFQVAHGKYLADATTLSDGDIEQLAVISDKLAARARAKREGFVPAETPEERKMFDRLATRRELLGSIEEVFLPAVAVERFKRKQLEAQVVEMGKKLEDLTSEVNYFKWVPEREAEKVPQ